jgi:iron complex transport system ATP-binding protein
LIARALAQAAPLLVMDEPTASLDFGNQALVLGHVRRLRRQGFGIVLSTHDPGHAFACATAAALLHGGEIVALGPAEAVLTPARLAATYGVPVLVGSLGGRGPVVCALDLEAVRPAAPPAPAGN